MRKGIAAIICVCSFFLIFSPQTAARVDTVKEPTAENTVYIAGNPDLYPVEYYDVESESYAGMLPELYAKISESTGIDFSYIRAGDKNEQLRLAENRQVEVVSAYLKGEITDLHEEYYLFSFEKDGLPQEVCIGFTDIAQENTVEQIKAYFDSVSDSELLSLSVSVSEHSVKTMSVSAVVSIIMVLLIIIGVLVCLTIRRTLKEKEYSRNRLNDPLTGIGNELYFDHCFRHYVSADSGSLYYIAYIALDVHRIEKYLGTSEAEELQRYAAGILSSTAGDTDFVGRIEAGVFALAFQCPSEEQASVRIREILDRLNGYDERFSYDHQTLFTAGIFHIESSNILCETAIFNARQGYLYAVKSKLMYAFSDEKLLSNAAFKKRLERKLTDAVKNNEFKLYFQFIVNAETGCIIGAEALSRWQNPEEGLLTPVHYIEQMKKAGIIDHLDFYVLEESCRILEEWSGDDKTKNLYLSCNFTRITISQVDFLKRFEEIIDRYTFDRNKLIIELTEDSLADNEAIAYQNILSCKKAGVQIALDDLGSGYSSFSDLCDYPVDIIKIDRHIVAKSVTERGSALLYGITEFAHKLGMDVLCEGVETEEENTQAKKAGCDYIQGYYYSRVMPPEDAMPFFEKYVDMGC